MTSEEIIEIIESHRLPEYSPGYAYTTYNGQAHRVNITINSIVRDIREKLKEEVGDG